MPSNRQSSSTGGRGPVPPPRHVPGPYPPPTPRSQSSTPSVASPSSPGSPTRSSGVQGEMTQAQIRQLVAALQTHRINTITELRRVEKAFIPLADSVLIAHMGAAWAYYVNSNNLLNELRNLTPNYIFSSELLNEAKALVMADPNGTGARSQNVCRLVLARIRDHDLIRKHARRLAVQPAMWGDRQPSAANVEQLANACIREWINAMAIMLRHWA